MGFAGLSSTLGRLAAHKNVSLDTFLHLYVFSDTHDLPEMKERCLRFTEDFFNALAVLKSPSFFELPKEYLASLISNDTFVAPEYDILQAVLKWKEHNDISVEETEVSAFDSADSLHGKYSLRLSLLVCSVRCVFWPQWEYWVYQIFPRCNQGAGLVSW